MPSKGTGIKGQRLRKGRLHIRCIRCGGTSFHKIKKKCSSCGYGNSSKLRRYNWQKKSRNKWKKN